jgi:fluoride exporter
MSFGTVIALGLLGGAGAVSRFLVDGAVARRVGRSFPFGTLAVNLSGAFVLGILVGAALHTEAYRLFGVGLIGAYTTFSTWALESHRLSEDGQERLGAANFAVSLVLGVAVAWLGRKIGAGL